MFGANRQMGNTLTLSESPTNVAESQGKPYLACNEAVARPFFNCSIMKILRVPIQGMLYPTSTTQASHHVSKNTRRFDEGACHEVQ